MDSNNPVEERLSKMDGMLQKEDEYLIRHDYLRGLESPTEYGLPLDAEARGTIASWCSNVMNICQYQKDTAFMAVNYLDRYVASTHGRRALLDRRQYQLASLACIYLAVKLHESQPLTPKLISNLSNGDRGPEDIELMELEVLKALKWRLHPPTAMLFVNIHLNLIHSDEIDCVTRAVLLELSEVQIEASLSEYAFVSEKQSKVGLAALLNAADSLCEHGSLRAGLECIIHQCTYLIPSDLSTLRIQLYECMASAEEPSSLLPALRKPAVKETSFADDPSSVSFATSPRTVLS